MKTLTLEASGHMRFSWASEHAISHFLHPLHLESSLAIQIGSFLADNPRLLSKRCGFSLGFLGFKSDDDYDNAFKHWLTDCGKIGVQVSGRDC